MNEYYILLQLCLGFANRKGAKALRYFKTPDRIFNATHSELAASKIFSEKDLEKISAPPLKDAQKISKLCAENSIRIVPFGSLHYPNCLSEISDPPIVLYVNGKMPDFDDTPTICIVGPRNVSDFGKKAAYSLSYRLAAAGFTVVSGGALGTDTHAHAGAIKAGGQTVLCMGCGILSNYLIKNKELRQCVSKCGCLISEYPPETNASRFTFPQRNRIMSALSLGTVVIEAPEKSGSLITASHAAEQGRDVFVIPGAPNLNEYKGSNALLRDGAKPLLDVSDIFNEYIVRFSDKINIENAYKEPIISEKPKENSLKIPDENAENTENFKKIQKKLPETLSNVAKVVYNTLDKQKFYPEEIVSDVFTSGQILSALTELEMEFLIKSVPGGMYEIV